MQFKFKIPFLTFIAIAATAMSSCEQPAARSGPVVTSGEAAIGGPYELVNHLGEPVTQDSFTGRPQLIYFGFSFCPDVCPMALQQMGLALDDVDPDGSVFQPIFISVDPERDTPEALAQYVSARGFPLGLIGLTGTAEQIDKVKAAYKIYSTKVEDPDSTAGYTVDHVSLIFLMDENGKFADVFTHSTTTAEIIRRLQEFKNSR